MSTKNKAKLKKQIHGLKKESREDIQRIKKLVAKAEADQPAVKPYRKKLDTLQNWVLNNGVAQPKLPPVK